MTDQGENSDVERRRAVLASQVALVTEENLWLRRMVKLALSGKYREVESPPPMKIFQPECEWTEGPDGVIDAECSFKVEPAYWLKAAGNYINKFCPNCGRKIVVVSED